MRSMTQHQKEINSKSVEGLLKSDLWAEPKYEVSRSAMPPRSQAPNLSETSSQPEVEDESQFSRPLKSVKQQRSQVPSEFSSKVEDSIHKTSKQTEPTHELVIKLHQFNNLNLRCSVKNCKPLVRKAAYGLLVYLTRTISASSDVCYRPNNISYDSQKQEFLLPITVQYHNEEGNIVDIINKRVETIKRTILNVKFETNRLKFIARTLKQYNIDPFNFLQLSYTIGNDDNAELVSTPIELNIPDVPNFEIREHINSEGNFRHLEYIDPLLLDYGLYIGLSKPFKDMGYAYNALHIYEHMMTMAWKKLDSKDMIELNGATFPTGICYLYNIHSTSKSLKKYAREYVKFHQMSKTRKFWEKDLNEDLKRETIRTYSETQTSKGLKEFARTDNTVYSDLHNMKYPIEPFLKFSNDTYTILTVSPEPIDFKFDKYIPDIDPDVPKISERKYDFIPLAALRNANNLVVVNKKDMTQEIYSKNACLFGVDCVGLCMDDDTKECETLNTVLLFMLRNDINLINEFMKNKTMPIDNRSFSSLDVYCNFLNEFNDFFVDDV